MTAPPGAKSSLVGFFFITLFLHIIDVWLGRYSGNAGSDGIFLVVYAILGLGAILLVFRDEKSVWGEIAIVTVIAYGLPYLTGWLSKSNNLISALTLTLVLAFGPTWTFYLGLRFGDRLGKVGTVFWVYFTLWMVCILILTLPNIQKTQNAFSLGESIVLETSPWEALKTFGTNVKVAFLNLVNNTKTEADKQIAFAKGDTYTGKVDSQAKTKLGITLADLKLTQPSFSTEDSVGVYSLISGEAIDTPLAVKISCTGKDNANSLVTLPKISPDTSVTALDLGALESADVDCTFAPKVFTAGKATITVGAEFNTQTLAYLKTYLMDKDRLRENRAAKIDPFQQYGITDRAPVTVYTSGPVNIGMSFGTPPVGIGQNDNEFSSTLGITITNAWTGTIKKLDKAIIIIPRGFHVSELTGGGTIKPISCLDLSPLKDWCDDGVATAYEIIPITPEGGILAGKALTLRAQLKAQQGDYAMLLGSSPISTRYFKTAVNYTYVLEKSATATINKLDATGTGSSTCGGAKLDGTIAREIIPEYTKFVFKTDKSTATEIRYCVGPSTVACSAATINYPTANKEHSINITGLSPNTLYAYKISSICGTKIPLEESTFTTP